MTLYGDIVVHVPGTMGFTFSLQDDTAQEITL